MSDERVEFNPNTLTGLTEIIHWAAKLGRCGAEAENVNDSHWFDDVCQTFEGRLSEMPRNSLGGFYIFGDAAIVAYTEAYVKYKKY